MKIFNLRSVGRVARSAMTLIALSAAAREAGAGPAIDGPRVWRDLERIVKFGPRPSGSPQLERTRRYIIEELRKAGVKTRVQSFTAKTPLGPVSMANVIGEIPGKSPDVILIGGHYDTKYFPGFRFVGANDGGSSAALLIELGRKLAVRSGGYTVWIVFFDGEEEASPDSNRGALYGSKFMVDQLAKGRDLGRLRAGIVVDMIGDRDLGILKDAGSTAWLTDALWKSAGRLGRGSHFLEEAIPMEDDHAPFLRAGVPTALLIDYEYGDGNRFWHSPDDTLDKLSVKSLETVGAVVLEALPAIERELDRKRPRR